MTAVAGLAQLENRAARHHFTAMLQEDDDQLFQSKKTISKFSDGKTDNICRSLCRDSSLPVAELAVTRLKVLAFWIRHQDRTGRMVGVT